MPIIRILITLLLVCLLPARIHAAEDDNTNKPVQLYLFDKTLEENEMITLGDLSNTFLELKEGYTLSKGIVKVSDERKQILTQTFKESTAYHEWIRTKLVSELSLKPEFAIYQLQFELELLDAQNQKQIIRKKLDLSPFGRTYMSEKVNFTYQNKPIDSKLLLASRFSETDLNIDKSLKLRSISVLLAKNRKIEHLEEVTTLEEYQERVRIEIGNKMQSNKDEKGMYAVSYILFLENEKGVLIQQSRLLNIYPY